MPETHLSPNNAYQVVGTRPIRHDGLEKVTGAALFGSDITIPGLLHGKMLRSPHPHARIKSIDLTQAQSYPGVQSAVTSKDLPDPGPVPQELSVGFYPSDNILARNKVLYVGQAVAAVAATNPHIAEEALSLINVEYEPLPFVTNVEESLKPQAPLLHEHWSNDFAGEGPLTGINIDSHEQHGFGDLDKGFAKSYKIIEREFRTKTVHQGYIEPQNATASWRHDGRLMIWCSSQGQFGIRDNTARILGISESNIKVIPMEIGGGFGGKLTCYLEPVAALLSKKAGRPVKMTMTRTEVLEATGPTSGSYIKVKIGVTKQGVISTAYICFAFEAGAFPGGPLAGASASAFAPYNIQNVRIDGYDVVVNKPKTAPYRAPGAPMVCYAVESTIDEIAESLEMDPMELRLLNVTKEGCRRADGVTNGVIGARATMEAVTSHPHYNTPLDGKYAGRGTSMGFCRNNTGPSCAIANVISNGSVTLIEGSPDIGGTRTSVSQQLAEALGIPIDSIIPQVGDTDAIGYTSATGGSGVTFKTGWAAYEAAQDIKRQFIQRAAKIWDVDINNIEYDSGVIQHKSDPELKMDFKEMASLLDSTGGPVVGKSNLNPGGSGGSYAANIVDVDVDIETGKVDIKRFTAIQDAGTAIHPAYVEGQIQGGTAQGVGWALYEEYFMGNEGKMENSSFLDYRMPTSLDLPMIDTVIVEVPNPGHPYGVRGVGEANIAPPLAAIANAIYNAIGTRMYQLPMNPQKVLEAIKKLYAGQNHSAS